MAGVKEACYRLLQPVTSCYRPQPVAGCHSLGRGGVGQLTTKNHLWKRSKENPSILCFGPTPIITNTWWNMYLFQYLRFTIPDDQTSSHMEPQKLSTRLSRSKQMLEPILKSNSRVVELAGSILSRTEICNKQNMTIYSFYS